jgi:Zn-dependent peptidase ImmA (M78 family)
VTEIKDEQRANEIALELLMPRNFLERDLKGKALDFEDDSEIRSLAEKYRVSSQLMTLRLSSKIFSP